MTVEELRPFIDMLVTPAGGWLVSCFLFLALYRAQKQHIETLSQTVEYERKRADAAVQQLINDCRPD